MDDLEKEHPKALSTVEHHPLLQRDIPCLEGIVTLAFTQPDTCWVSISSACKVLGLNARGQQQRITRKEELAQAYRQLALSTKGGPQHIACLKVECVAEWLGTLQSGQTDHYPLFIQQITDAASLLREEAQSQAQQLLLLPINEIPLTSNEETQAVTTTLPGVGQILIFPNVEEEQVIRKATLARKNAWRDEPKLGAPYYAAPSGLRVYFGDPKFPLKPEAAKEALEKLRESTILTARYILGRWNIAREQGQLVEEGSVPIRVEDLLEYRGIKPHSRAIGTGEARKIEDYEPKYFRDAQGDFRLLGHFWLKGPRPILVEGTWKPMGVDSYYLRIGRWKNLETDKSLYFAAPGNWIIPYLSSGGLWLAELDQRVFQLNPMRHQVAMRWALFASEYWQWCLMNGTGFAPLTMQEWLTHSMIPINHEHLTDRTVPQVDRAIEVLKKQGILKAAIPERIVSREPAQWGREWLATRWTMIPPDDVVQRHLYRMQGRVIDAVPSPLFLPGGNRAFPGMLETGQEKTIRQIPSEEKGLVNEGETLPEEEDTVEEA